MDSSQESLPEAVRLGTSKKLFDPETRLRVLLQSIREHAVLVTDPEGRVAEWSDAALQMLGYTAEEVLGQPSTMFYPPEVLAELGPDSVLKKADRQGRYQEQHWMVRKDGTRIWTDGVVNVLHEEDGRVVGFIKVLRDQTEQKRAAEMMHLGEERYRMIVEGLKDYAIFTMDRSGDVATWNAGAERLLGYSEREILGKPAAKIFTYADQAADVPAKEMLNALGNGKSVDERWHMRKDESIFWASGVLWRLQDEAGDVIGFVKILRDTTDRKKAEASLLMANEKLEERVQERTRELVDYQRQLRALASELSLTEHRERKRIATELHDHLLQVLAVCKMKTAILRKHLESGELPLAFQQLNEHLDEAVRYGRLVLSELSPPILELHDLAAALEWQAKRMQVHDLHVIVEDNGKPKPLAQDILVLLFQSVRELLFNIVKHAHTSSAIVSMQRKGHELWILVQDDGAGFDAAAASKSRRDEDGFGLFSVRERMERCGGRLEIDSAPGKGTRSLLVVPLVEEALPEGEESLEFDTYLDEV